ATQSAVAAALASAPRPSAIVTASAVSPDGRYVLQRRTGLDVTLISQADDFRLNLREPPILCAAFTPDSRSFVTGHGDSQVRVWDSQTGGHIATLRGSTAAIWSVAVAAEISGGYRVAAGSEDGSVVVWDLAAQQEVARLPSLAADASTIVEAAHWSADCPLLPAWLAGQWVVRAE